MFYFQIWLEIDFVGNELEIQSIKKNDANFYECIAKNSVPPATSRIFNLEIECNFIVSILFNYNWINWLIFHIISSFTNSWITS